MPFRMSCWFIDVPPIPFYGLQLAVANLFNKLNLKWNKEIREVIHSFLATAARLGGCRRFFPRLVVAFSRPVLLVARPQFLKLRQFVALDSFNQFGCLIRADVNFDHPMVSQLWPKPINPWRSANGDATSHAAHRPL